MSGVRIVQHIGHYVCKAQNETWCPLQEMSHRNYGPGEDRSILQWFSSRNSLVFTRAIFRLLVLVLDVTFHFVFGHVMSYVLNNTYARYHSYVLAILVFQWEHNRRTSTPKQHRPLYGRWRQWHGHLISASVLSALVVTVHEGHDRGWYCLGWL